MDKTDRATTAVYGIGNPLIDIHVRIEERELEELGLQKGTMTLIDTRSKEELLTYLGQREMHFSCGGAAPNTMVTLAALGIQTTLAGMVGGDEHGDIYQERLQERGVISHLVRGDESTGTSLVLVTPDNERTMNTLLGACRGFGPEHVNHQSLGAADYFYFTGYMWDTPSQQEALLAAVETARKKGVQVVFDLADPFAVERHNDDFHNHILGKVDYLFANKDEAKLLFGLEDPRLVAAELAGMGLTAAVKLGAQGSLVATPDGVITPIKTCRVETVDCTGAGDNYAAGFLYGLMLDCEPAEAGRIGSYVASQIVCQTGAQLPAEKAKQLAESMRDKPWKHL